MAKTPSLTVRAQWVGPYGDRFVDGTVLVPNETVCEMPRSEAELSDNWKVLAGAVTGDEPQAPSIPHALAAIEAAKAEPQPEPEPEPEPTTGGNE